jgi:hypothetical protein
MVAVANSTLTLLTMAEQEAGDPEEASPVEVVPSEAEVVGEAGKAILKIYLNPEINFSGFFVTQIKNLRFKSLNRRNINPQFVLYIPPLLLPSQ